MTISPQGLAQLPTPCLVIDLGAADRNIARMASDLRSAGLALRPHFKAHKCVSLLRRQLDAGTCSGVTCQTTWEALALAHHGIGDILLSNQVTDPYALSELGEAAAMVDVTVVVDDVAQVAALAEVTARHKAALGVLVEIDVGMGRCGLPPGSPALPALVAAIQDAPGLTFRGLQGYEGHAVLVDDPDRRRELTAKAAAALAGERDRLAAEGIGCDLVTGGGTGTYDLAAENGVLQEVQAGSYVLMDAAYGRPGMARPFENALFCAARVISRTSPERGVLNAGLKELSGEFGPPLSAASRVTVTRLSDEHSIVEFAESAPQRMGDVVPLIPAHVDPTINLHDRLYAWDGHRMAAWPVEGRRTLPTRDRLSHR
ncbi:MAG: DSD1 family PLP-dependent enzyme [Streptosporangiales bacterium]|nr:DSD1 family PLP-dependent enzyme [Streptosporangiales bacterium]